MWAPSAARLGLRYVAHVVQAGHYGLIPAHLPAPAPFELQVFQNLAQARHWLRACRDTSPPHAT